MAKKLSERGYRVEREKPIPVNYEGTQFEVGFRADLMIEDCFIVERKSTEHLLPVHGKQLLIYLRLSGMRLGLLINFGEELVKDGIKRIANECSVKAKSCLPQRHENTGGGGYCSAWKADHSSAHSF